MLTVRLLPGLPLPLTLLLQQPLFFGSLLLVCPLCSF